MTSEITRANGAKILRSVEVGASRQESCFAKTSVAGVFVIKFRVSWPIVPTSRRRFVVSIRSGVRREQRSCKR